MPALQTVNLSMFEADDAQGRVRLPLIPTIVIGDTHADLDTYRALIDQEEARFGGPMPSIHVGDYGFGHFSPREEREVQQFHRRHTRHRFLRGNHDAPSLIHAAPGFLPDGAVSGAVLFLGGADGGLLGEDTEITARAADHILSQLDRVKAQVQVLISHDAPQYVAEALHADMSRDTAMPGFEIRPTRTRAFLAEVAEILAPQLWMFGHWHHGWEARFDDTHFRALGYQESFVIPLPWDPKVIQIL